MIRSGKNAKGSFNAEGQFFSLEDLNAAIREEVARLNARISRHFGASRQHLFETIERPATVAQARHDPALHEQDRSLDLGLVARLVGAGRQDG